MTELVLIAVCTRRRPQMLAKCLMSLLEQYVPLPNVQLQILVVENDDVAKVKQQSLALNGASPFPLHYVQESNQGLSHARNRALSEALARGAGWLAFIDDDEVAEPQWISELYRVAQALQADVVRGPVKYHYPPEDNWAHLRDTGRKTPLLEGTRIAEGATNNILFSRRLFAKEGMNLHFDLRLNFTGGEDKLFFLEAHTAHAHMVFAPTALVHEFVPLSRCSLAMLWRDKARLASNSILIERDILMQSASNKSYWLRAWKESVNAFKHMIRATKSLLRHDGQAKRHTLKSMLALARVQGILAGLFKHQQEAYRQIHGH